MKVSVSTKGSLRIKTLIGAVDNILDRENNPEELQAFLNRFLLPSLVRAKDVREQDMLLDQLSRIYQRMNESTAELTLRG